MTETLQQRNRQFRKDLLDSPPECTEMNPDYWFADPADDEEKFGRSERAIAQSTCKRCPFMLRCFSYAIDNKIEDGVWGGSMPQQRIAYWRKVEETAHKAAREGNSQPDYEAV